jgi:hypothetical protein
LTILLELFDAICEDMGIEETQGFTDRVTLATPFVIDTTSNAK